MHERSQEREHDAPVAEQSSLEPALVGNGVHLEAARAQSRELLDGRAANTDGISVALDPAGGGRRHVATIFFDYNSASLRPDSLAIVQNLAQQVNLARVSRLEVVGYASKSGSRSRNARLSWDRATVVANAVRNHLIVSDLDGRLPEISVSCAGRGESEAGGATQARRVDVFMSAPSQRRAAEGEEGTGDRGAIEHQRAVTPTERAEYRRLVVRRAEAVREFRDALKEAERYAGFAASEGSTRFAVATTEYSPWLTAAARVSEVVAQFRTDSASLKNDIRAQDMTLSSLESSACQKYAIARIKAIAAVWLQRRVEQHPAHEGRIARRLEAVDKGLRQ